MKSIIKTLTEPTIDLEKQWAKGKANHAKGSFKQRDRLAMVAEECCKRTNSGDIIEIGCYLGETTVRLAEVARKYNRRVIAVDPWQKGTQNCTGIEYDTFLRNTRNFHDIIDIVRLSSLSKEAKDIIRDRELCFAYVDGLHTPSAMTSDIKSVLHCKCVIAVDDLSWSPGLKPNFIRIAKQHKHETYHHPNIREGYIIIRD